VRLRGREGLAPGAWLSPAGGALEVAEGFLRQETKYGI